MKNEVAVFFMDLETLNMNSDTFFRNVGAPDQAQQRHIPEDHNRSSFVSTFALPSACNLYNVPVCCHVKMMPVISSAVKIKQK